MRILVTGSTGFIGSQIVRALAKQGEQVRAFHRPESSLLALQGLDVEHAVGDITRPETLAEAMQGIEVLFHAAAKVGRRDRGDMQAVTAGGAQAVFHAALSAGVRRVVHTSSVAALGVPFSTSLDTYASPLIDENHTWNYRPEWWPYGFAKYRAEIEAQKAVAQGLDVVIVNPAVVVGAGDLNRISGDLILRVARNQVPVSTPGGVNVVHIEDVVRGHLAALERGRTGERYILGGDNLSIYKFLQLIAAVTGGRPPLFSMPKMVTRALAGPVTALRSLLPLPVGGEMLRMAGNYFWYDTTKARVELGLEKPLPVQQAVAEAYAWYQEQGGESDG